MKRKLELVPVLLLAILALAVTRNVLAQANPYYIGVGQAFTYEDNLFRVAEGRTETSDVYSTTSLLAGIDQPFGRQRFYTDAVIRHNRYRDQDTLNNTGYGLDVGLDWETIERLSGKLAYTVNEKLARFGVDQGPLIIGEPNEERSQQLLARAQLGGEALLALEGTLMHRRLDYSAPAFSFREFNQDSASIGVQYRPSGLLVLGAALRATRGEFPSLADEFDRNDVDLTAVWTPSGLSKLSARLSYTQEEHNQFISRDLNGLTGALSWEYKPTGKLVFTTDLIRDSGTESSFSSTGAETSTPTGTSSRLSTAARVRVLYEATAKIQLEGNVQFVHRDLVSTTTIAGGGTSTEPGTDRTTELALGARYMATRSLLFACSVGTERRRASVNSTVSYPYSAGKASCSAQFVLQ